jgi:sortase B
MSDKNIEFTNTSDLLQKSESIENKNVNRKKQFKLYKLLRSVLLFGFVIFTSLFIYEVFITPYRINHSIENTEQLYKTKLADINQATATQVSTNDFNIEKPIVNSELVADSNEIIPVIDSNRDSQGRLLQFNDLIALNKEVKGWITIPQTNIDYVVMQSSYDDPEYYLTRDIEKQELKAGSLFLDYKCSVEEKSQNLTIHGHNMTSTDNMFHYLIKFKDLDYYKERPVFTFDTIYQTGQWKIFSVFITNGSSEKEEFFDYTKPDFNCSDDFMNYIYQLRIRSLFHIDTVDINENDQLLTLSTCSYEVKNYRTVIVARRLREGEDPSVDVDSVTINKEPLYPYSYYYRYGGKAPELTKTFEEALENGEIKWYSSIMK